MKALTLKAAQNMDLFGLVTLAPGANEVEDDVWAKLKVTRLGIMEIPFVQWAKTNGILDYEDDETATAVESDSGEGDAPADDSATSAPPESDSVAPKKRGRPAKGT